MNEENNKIYDENLEYQSATQTLIGSKKRTLIDQDTAEVIEVDQITKRVYGTKSFWKCYLMDFLSVLGVFDSRQADVFIYICENTNKSTNIFMATYKKIAEDTGCSSATISRIMKKLQDFNFLKAVQQSVYIINPNILMSGNDNKRQILLSYYQSDEPIEEITYAKITQKEIPTKDVKSNKALPASYDHDES